MLKYEVKFIHNKGDIEIEVNQDGVYYKRSLNKKEILDIKNIIDKNENI